MIAPLAESLTRLYARAAFTGRGGYRLVRLVRRARPRERWRDVFRTPGGLTFELDLGTYPDCCMAFGLYELETAKLIQRLLRPGDHFVDGGANLGYFTLMASQRVGPQGRVDAFEPDPMNRQRLLDNLARNGSPACVTVHPKALGDREGHATLHRPDPQRGNHGMASLFASEDLSDTDTVSVELTTLDAALPSASPRLIKLDLEGAEAQAIEGMRRIVTSPNPPHVILEHNPTSSQAAGVSSTGVVRRLMELQPRYRARIIDFPSKRLDPSLAGLAERGQVNVHLDPE